MRAFTAVAVVMQGIQREILQDKRYSEGINKKNESNLSLAYSIFFDKNDTSKNLNLLHRVENLCSLCLIFSLN